jgi:hypothetical protein
MKSLQIFNAVMLAAAAAFAVTMGVVALIYGVYLDTEPRIRQEWPTVLAVTEVFFMLSAVAGLAFHAQRRRKPWRWPAQLLMLGGFGVGGWILYRLLIAS